MDLSFILSPKFLVDNIDVISLIIAGFLLIMFDNFVTERAFALADAIRERSARKLREFGQKTNLKKVETYGAKYFSEFLSTFIVLAYCYLGTIILARYVFAPILTSLKDILLIVVIVLFLVISYAVNTKNIRKLLREA